MEITAEIAVVTTVARLAADGNPAVFCGTPRHAAECGGIPRAYYLDHCHGHSHENVK